MNCKFILRSVVVFSLLWNFTATQAQDYQSSLGGRLGTYVALSYNHYVAENASVEGITGITRLANQSNFLFGGYYKRHVNISSRVSTLSFYFGPGALVNFVSVPDGTNVVLALSGLVGLEYAMEHVPVNFFLDIGPYYNVNSDLGDDFDLHANVGVRYILNR